MSQSPGIRYLLRPSTTLAAFGTVVEALFPSCKICLPWTITVMSACTGAPVASIRFTWIIARMDSCPITIRLTEIRNVKNNRGRTIFLSNEHLAKAQILLAAEWKHKSTPETYGRLKSQLSGNERAMRLKRLPSEIVPSRNHV